MNHFDVIVVGAGISGIGAGYYLGARCPSRTYAILEGRAAIGGTWDLFRYPGIRSDSDMYTLGFAFAPWTQGKAIADGPSILHYLEETARRFDIDRHIRLSHQVRKARFSNADDRWTLDVDTEDGPTQLTCNFLFMCAGYYDPDDGYTPDFEGTGDYRGRIVHPQKWTSDVDYAGKRVVVIGSGATAITLVPELAKKAEHVTMLQRSPTYIVSLPEVDAVAERLRARLGDKTAYAMTRVKNVLFAQAFYQACKRAPRQMKKMILDATRKELGPSVELEPHFVPSYDPWDQRVCFAPDGDFFEPVRSGKVTVVTDHIERFTERGILLRSGQELEADLVVTATGLRVRFLGGVEVYVDDQRIRASEHMTYKAMMLSDVPNLALAFGYTNASWTLKVDITCEYVCRLLNHMERHGQTRCTPRTHGEPIGEERFVDLSSGYIDRALDQLPKQGSRAPWKLKMNYLRDYATVKLGKLEDGVLELR
ncbi:MAG: flavin-containing monooxygenase [Sandaracinaceae bacterium]